MKKISYLLAALLLISGCAAMSNGSTQSLTIATQNEDSKQTICSASNEEGRWDNLAPGIQFTVERDGNPLDVQCHNEHKVGSVSVEPEFQTRFLMMDIILVDACIISCIIDGGTNAFYDYPDTVTVPMANK